MEARVKLVSRFGLLEQVVALREYYPAALETFTDLADSDTLGVLAKVPTPVWGATLTLGQIQVALKRGGRQRNIERRAGEIRANGDLHHQALRALANRLVSILHGCLAVQRRYVV